MERRMPNGVVAGLLLLTVATGSLEGQQAIRLKPPEAVLSDPDMQFTWLTGVREMSDGRLMVVDYRENRLELLDRALERATPIGREGDGPGEYRKVGWSYALGGDSTIVTDPQTRSWYVLTGSRIAQRLTQTDTAVKQFDPIVFGVDRNRRVLFTKGHKWTPPNKVVKETADSLVLLLGVIGSRRVDTIAVLAGQSREMREIFSGAGPGASTRRPALASPFVTEDLGLLFPDGWIAVVRVNPYRVEWRPTATPTRWIRGAPLPFARKRPTNADKCALMRPSRDNAPACDPATVGAPETLPPFLAISGTGMYSPATPTLRAMPDGRLLIRRTPGTTSGNRYDIVDRSGALSATLTLAANETVIGFGEKSIYIVATDKDNLQTLRRHPWP
jgi:hypothetical protein